MADQNKTIVEINGVKLEVDLRYARRIEEMRVGDRVKVLKKKYDGHEVLPGIIVGFEPFNQLPTIVVAYVENTWDAASVKFLHFNAKSKDDEIVAAADEDFTPDRDRIIASFDKMIATKQREIETIEAQRRYFENNFRQYWSKVVAEAPAATVEE